MRKTPADDPEKRIEKIQRKSAESAGKRYPADSAEERRENLVYFKLSAHWSGIYTQKM